MRASRECAQWRPGWHLGLHASIMNELVQDTTMITALKQLYEHYHSKDLAALKRTYERHAEDCAQAAELTVDPGRREVYLNLAREWTEAAAALQAQTQ
jgi:hypothetical protein